MDISTSRSRSQAVPSLVEKPRSRSFPPGPNLVVVVVGYMCLIGSFLLGSCSVRVSSLSLASTTRRYRHSCTTAGLVRRSIPTATGTMDRPDNHNKESSDPTFNQPKPLVVVLAGPTGVGKSDVAAHLCQRLGGMIVSADSVQAYKGVSIGANKPTPEERRATPHLLVDLVDPAAVAYNAADWQSDAWYVLDHMTGKDRGSGDNDTTNPSDQPPQPPEDRPSRWHDIDQSLQDARHLKHYTPTEPIVPVVVGGTMMYLQWLVHGRPDAAPPTPEAVEQATRIVEDFQTRNDWDGAYRYVAQRGPVFADRLTTLAGRDWYRLRRILEIALTSPSPSSSSQDSTVPPETKKSTVPSEAKDATIENQDNTQDITQHLPPPPPEAIESTTPETKESPAPEKKDATTENQDNKDNTNTKDHHPPPQPPETRLFTGQRQGSLASRGYDVRCFFLCPDDRMAHTKLVDERCERMLLKGLLSETARLRLAGELPDGLARAIGYRQTLEYLERSDPRDDDVDALMHFVNEFTTATRRYSKKQMQWFRKDGSFVFVPVALARTKEQRVAEAATAIQELLQLSRDDYEEACFGAGSATSVSTKTIQQNEAQAKGMKVYQFQRYLLKPGTPELAQVLAEADRCTNQLQAKKRCVADQRD